MSDFYMSLPLSVQFRGRVMVKLYANREANCPARLVSWTTVEFLFIQPMILTTVYML